MITKAHRYKMYNYKTFIFTVNDDHTKQISQQLSNIKKIVNEFEIVSVLENPEQKMLTKRKGKK